MAAPKTKPSPAQPKPAQLQRLGFVRDASAAGAEYASGLYGAAKGRLPAFVRQQAEKAEGVVAQYGAPAYEKLLAAAEEALKYTDAKADTAIHVGADATARVRRSIRPELIGEKAAHTRDVLLVKIQETLSVVQKQGVYGTLRQTTVEAVRIPQRVLALFLDETKRVADATHDRAAGVLSFAVTKSQRVVDAAQAKTQQAHDILVKQPLYKDAYERTNTVLSAAQDTAVYRETVKRIYPIVAPVYEPTFEKIEPYYKSTLNYWKPISAAA